MSPSGKDERVFDAKKRTGAESRCVDYEACRGENGVCFVEGGQTLTEDGDVCLAELGGEVGKVGWGVERVDSETIGVFPS